MTHCRMDGRTIVVQTNLMKLLYFAIAGDTRRYVDNFHYATYRTSKACGFSAHAIHLNYIFMRWERERAAPNSFRARHFIRARKWSGRKAICKSHSHLFSIRSPSQLEWCDEQTYYLLPLLFHFFISFNSFHSISMAATRLTVHSYWHAVEMKNEWRRRRRLRPDDDWIEWKNRIQCNIVCKADADCWVWSHWLRARQCAEANVGYNVLQG